MSRISPRLGTQSTHRSLRNPRVMGFLRPHTPQFIRSIHANTQHSAEFERRNGELLLRRPPAPRSRLAIPHQPVESGNPEHSSGPRPTGVHRGGHAAPAGDAEVRPLRDDEQTLREFAITPPGECGWLNLVDVASRPVLGPEPPPPNQSCQSHAVAQPCGVRRCEHRHRDAPMDHLRL